MTNMKCPFCKKELKLIGEKSDSGYPIDEYVCSCPETAFSFGNTVMWNKLRVLYEKLKEKMEDCELAKKELIRTRKALDVAIERLEQIAHESFQGDQQSINLGFHIRAAAALTDIEQITALEQKENKNGKL